MPSVSIRGALNALPILAIRIYQRGRRNKPKRCLRTPSCSQYAILALQKYGPLKALRLSYARYRDCHPLSDRPLVDHP